MHSDLEKLVARGKLDQPTAEKLDALQPGTFCFHKSWGAGQVESWDRLAVKITINFEDKEGHEMGMKFAADSLEPLEEGHFLATRYSNLDELQALAKDDPVELTKRVLAGRGGMLYLQDFETLVKGRIVPDGKYKGWWESTKKKLRTDRQLVVPSKRNEPLELRAAGTSPTDALVEEYKNARDLKGKVKSAEAILKDLSLFESPADLIPVIEDITDAARKGMKLYLGAAVELILVRDELQSKEKELKFDDDQITIAEVVAANRDELSELLRGLSLSRLRQVLSAFEDAFGETWVQDMLALIPLCNLRTIGEIANFLSQRGLSDTVLEFFESGLQQRALSSDALAWVCRERKRMTEVIFDPSLSLAVMSSLEQDSLDDEGGTRAANRLRDLLADDKNLIPDLIGDADINTVRNFAGRLMGSNVFDDLTRKSLMARIVKIYPAVQDLITGREKTEDDILIVSEESLERRQAAFQKLVREEIPQNREDIKIARSYGDLRENFEYKSAKEYQRVLMKRKADWEGDLKQAKAVRFEGVDASKVNIGTVVSLEKTASGEKLDITILGAWDSDPENHVIAYLSGRGQILLGKKTGDEVGLPNDSGGTETYRILGIKPYAS